MPDFDLAATLLSVVFGGVGFVAFRYGRKMQRMPPLVLGMALMLYPLLVSGLVWTAAVGLGLTSGLWLWRE